MILKERPTKEQIREDKPNFWLIAENSWNGKENKPIKDKTDRARTQPMKRKLLDWLIWHGPNFTVKTRIDYLQKHYKFTVVLVELVKLLHQHNYRVFLDKNILMIWK